MERTMIFFFVCVCVFKSKFRRFTLARNPFTLPAKAADLSMYILMLPSCWKSFLFSSIIILSLYDQEFLCKTDNIQQCACCLRIWHMPEVEPSLWYLWTCSLVEHNVQLLTVWLEHGPKYRLTYFQLETDHVIQRNFHNFIYSLTAWYYQCFGYCLGLLNLCNQFSHKITRFQCFLWNFGYTKMNLLYVLVSQTIENWYR